MTSWARGFPMRWLTDCTSPPPTRGGRVAEAAELGPRRARTGEPLPPLLTGTAAAQRAGKIGAGHVRVIRRFLHQLPNAVDLGTREAAEAHLAELATQHRPDDLAGLAAQITAYLNPDGSYTDEDRARRRGLTLGKQGLDGMSELRALLTPEARARVEAVLAKTAAPGMCNPDDDTPVIDGPACQDAVQRDMRTSAQRNHDGLAPRSPRRSRPGHSNACSNTMRGVRQNWRALA